MQQDAHEFLNYLLNTIGDILLEERRSDKNTSGLVTSGSTNAGHHYHHSKILKSVGAGSAGAASNSISPATPVIPPPAAGESTTFQNINSSNHQPGGTSNQKSNETTWVHEIFQGSLTNETRCLNCETVSNHFEFMSHQPY
jgi:ubiquitin carboxyl-terminal hydrolase 12/46